MADSLKLQVLKALTTHLEGITDPAYPLVGAVFRGRTVYGDDSPTTMVSILEAPRPDTGQTAGELGSHRVADWQLLVQGWTKDDKENPTDPAYGFMDAVEQRLGLITAVEGHTGMPKDPSAFLLGRLVASFAFGPGVVRPPADGISSRAYFYLPVVVRLTSVVG